MQLNKAQLLIIKKFFVDKPVLKAYLYGSYSREEASAESDIDLLVDLDYSQHIGLGFVQMKLDLERVLLKKVDLVPLDAVSKSIKPFIEQDKILVYER